MRQIKVMIFVLYIQLLHESCTKETTAVRPQPVSSITVVNAVVGSSPIMVDFNGNSTVSSYYSASQKIGYSSFYEFSVASGTVPFSAFQLSDTLTPIFKVGDKNNGIVLDPAGIYSLFLCGQLESGLPIDTLFTADKLPYHPPTDSSIGIRFVNLSPGSNPISVNIQGQPNGSEIPNLPYKGITSFKNYSAGYAVSKYIFELRDVNSGLILGKYTMNGINNGAINTSNNLYRFRNFTIVLKGLSGVTSGSAAQGIFLVNNY